MALLGSLLLSAPGTYLLALGLALAIVAAAVLRRGRAREIAVRVLVDGPVATESGQDVRLLGPDGGPVDDPSLAVIRISNVGRGPVWAGDYHAPMTLQFPGRTIVSADVIDPVPPDLLDGARASGGPRVTGDLVLLPEIDLPAGARYNVVCLLAGARPNGDLTALTVGGHLRGGQITAWASRQRPRSAIVAAAIALLLAGALTTALIMSAIRPDTVDGAPCAGGTLTVTTSTVLAPVVADLARTYESACPKAAIVVEAAGGLVPLTRLADAAAEDNRNMLGIAVVPAGQQPFPQLTGQPLAIVPYTLVGSANLGVSDLTTAQVRSIFTGEVSTWRDVGGPDRAIRVVARESAAGSRMALERYVLGSSQAVATSDSCATLRPGSSQRPLICERGTDADVLDRVSTLDGAIGYTTVAQARTAKNVASIAIDGRNSTLAGVRSGYRFWSVASVYHVGPLTATSQLTQAFSTYLGAATAQTRLTAAGFYPCADPAASSLCLSPR